MGKTKRVAPQVNQENRIVNADQNNTSCININTCFNWFNDNFTYNLMTCSKDFLGINLFYHLFGITKQPSVIWKDNEYFVTQIEAAKDTFLYIKISNIAAQIILDNTLGAGNAKGDLKLKDLSELEAKIITAYNEFLFKNLSHAFLDKKEISKTQKSNNLIHLTFFVYSENVSKEEAGKIIFSIPENIIKKPNQVKYPEIPINIMQFTKSFTTANIFVGKSKITLEDLKNLEKEDIVILDKSNLHFMAFKNEDIIPFSVKPNPRMVVNIDKEQGGQHTMNDTNSPMKNIWDSLEVEVSAEFKKIKISLGELKQITEGLVVDLAPIIQNEIFMHIDGKDIATGELVIVGDKYAVKITKVFQETKHEQEMATQQAAMDHNHAEKSNESHNQNAPHAEEDDEDLDFDYSDFEIEDDI